MSAAKLSPWIGISLLIIIIIILLFVLYFTWWMYNTYGQDREDLDNVIAELKNLTKLSIGEENVDVGRENEQRVETNRRNVNPRRTRGFFNFLSTRRTNVQDGTTTL